MPSILKEYQPFEKISGQPFFVCVLIWDIYVQMEGCRIVRWYHAFLKKMLIKMRKITVVLNYHGTKNLVVKQYTHKFKNHVIVLLNDSSSSNTLAIIE